MRVARQLIPVFLLAVTAPTTLTAAAQGVGVEVRVAPPALRYEAVPRGRVGFVWVRGHWRWDGARYAWTQGHWERARAGSFWREARWERRASGWVYVPGVWVRGRAPVAVVAPPPPPAPAPRPAPMIDYGREGWVLLGQAWVAGRRDRDFIPVGRNQGRFSRVMLVVDQGDVEMHDLLITWGNGRTWSPAMRHYFREGARSRAIDLPANRRVIQSVQLLYGNVPGGRQAHVQLWAR